jgi:hypothetical protein
MKEIKLTPYQLKELLEIQKREQLLAFEKHKALTFILDANGVDINQDNAVLFDLDNEKISIQVKEK